MRWEKLLFMHWPVPPEAVSAVLPKQLELETFDGSAWVGLVPFTMPVFHLSCPPQTMMMPRSIRAFHECNVRTYVRYRGVPGVHFFSLDAASRPAVWGARNFWRLPYHFARIQLHQRGSEIAYTVQRCSDTSASMRCRWRIGAPLPLSPPPGEHGTLAHFVTERYCLYAINRRGAVLRSVIDHDPWPLREAQLLELHDTLIAAAGINVEGPPPLVHYAESIDVDGWSLRRA